jgi:sugar phosphate isomerase/epimerase
MRDHMGRILSLGSSTLLNASPVDTVKAAAVGAFAAVGIRVTGRSPGDGSATVAGNGPAIRQLQRLSDDRGVEITHVAAYWVTPDLALTDFQPVIDTAAELGAGMIVVNCGYADEARFVSFLASYCEAADRCGLRLVLEFMPYSGARTLEQAARMVDLAGRRNLGLMVDPLHLARSGGKPADLKGIAPDRIDIVQLCDAPLELPAGVELRTEALAGRQYPGEGALPLHELLDAVPPHVQIDVEAPCSHHAGLAPEEQARLTAAACRRFMAAYLAHRQETGQSATG